MKFEDYLKLNDCTPLEKTEQSWTFTTIKDGERIIVKRYPTEFDKLKEELAYAYINSSDLLKVPKLKTIGEDFIEMELIEPTGTPSIEEVIVGISGMYIASLNDSKAREYFPKLDLSKDKLFRKLDYVPRELEGRRLPDRDLMKRCEEFTNGDYEISNNYCLVHGDLKSPHVIKTEMEIFFIDLALVSVANPWYDLAFLYMERKDKEHAFDELCRESFDVLGKDFDVSRRDIKGYLRSAIFYRCLYSVGFAARHKPDKTLKRTLHELSEILEH